MRTKRIKLFYKLTPTEVIKPKESDLARKDEWIKSIQGTAKSEWEPKIIEVTYEEYDPEIDKQRRFFNGVCVLYYAIQNMDLYEGVPDRITLEKYREEILDNMLGFDYQTVNKVIRQRKSTSDFKTVQAWNNFLQLLEETEFENAGYEFPNSKNFWEVAEKYGGYENAKQIVIKQLQDRIKKRK